MRGSFRHGEPIPDTLAGLLRSVEPFGAVVSLMGYPEGALHMFVSIPYQPTEEVETLSSGSSMFESDTANLISDRLNKEYLS